MHLVLNSYGATLQKSNGIFLVVTEEGKQSIPPDKIRSISIGKSARVTSDAIMLAIKHEIDVLFVNDLGMPEGRVWSIKYGSVSTIRRAQLEFLYSSKVIPWVKELLQFKISNQAALLLALSTGNNEEALQTRIKYTLNAMEDHRAKILQLEGGSISDMAASLRGWEGASSRKYFERLSELLPEKWRFETRSRMPAHDPFNAYLNYAYGILYGKVEGALIKAGIDPYVGIFHRDDHNRPALVFDIIERYRIWMDYVVMRLFQDEALDEDLFSIDPHDKSCRIEPLGRRILIQSVNDYLSEIIEYNGLERSRNTHLEQYAFSLANFFIENRPDQ